MLFDIQFVQHICSPEVLGQPLLINRSISEIERAILDLEARGYRAQFEQRAALLQYEKGMSRDDADRQALFEIRRTSMESTVNMNRGSRAYETAF